MSGRLSQSTRYLRTLDLALLGRGFRFVVAGGAVAVVYLATTTVLSSLIGLPFQLALALGFATAVTAHFTLQRFFVWARHDAFALSVRHQIGRYAVISGTQYGSTVVITATLPSALHVSTTAVYIVWTVCISATSFVLFGRRVFHASGDTESDVR